jgi:hypothetical protein
MSLSEKNRGIPGTTSAVTFNNTCSVSVNDLNLHLIKRNFITAIFTDMLSRHHPTEKGTFPVKLRCPRVIKCNKS